MSPGPRATLLRSLAGALALASLSTCNRGHGVSSFSGLRWQVKSFENTPVGPGPNYFSASSENVWLDGEGFLHLRVSLRGGRWFCPEVVSERSFGYGTYVFTLGSRGDTLDPRVVLGMFTWDDRPDTGHVNAHREIDVELSRWGQPGNADFQYVVQPWDRPPTSIHRFDVGASAGTDTIHAFSWTPAGVTFTSARGSTWPPPQGSVIETWSYSGPATPTHGEEQARINLWLMDGRPPQSGQPQEVIVKRFQFIPP